MPTKNFNAFEKQIQSAFIDKTYADGLALADQEIENYPDHKELISYWQMCLAARMENPDRTNLVLDDMLQQGVWYGEALLLKSPSLAPLENHTEYRRLVEISRKMQANDPIDS
ncbi:MAG: hypothetical protein N2D54_07490, partial [Chloroflexota bacterium]